MDESVEVKYYISVQITNSVDRKEPTALLSFFHVGKYVGRYGIFEVLSLFFIIIFLYLLQILLDFFALYL